MKRFVLAASCAGVLLAHPGASMPAEGWNSILSALMFLREHPGKGDPKMSEIRGSDPRDASPYLLDPGIPFSGECFQGLEDRLFGATPPADSSGSRRASSFPPPAHVSSDGLSFHAGGRWKTEKLEGIEPGACGFYCDGKFIVWGGTTNAHEKVRTFDLRRRQWSEIPKPPIKIRARFGAAVDAKRFAVWQGINEMHKLEDGAIYDFEKRKWIPIPEGPLRLRLTPGMTWVRGKLFIWGGTNSGNFQACDDGGLFDPDKGEWKLLQKAEFQHKLAAPVVAAVGGKVLLWGEGTEGAGGGGILYDVDKDAWERLPEAPIAPRAGAGWTVAGSKVVILFGSEGGVPKKDGACFDMTRGAWEKLPEAPVEARVFPAVISSEGLVHAWGGFETDTWKWLQAPSPSGKNSGAALHLGSGRWEKLPDAPDASLLDRIFSR